jgi:N-acetylmuramoyl-L-alanine amidase
MLPAGRRVAGISALASLLITGAPSLAASKAKPRLDPWQAALASREAFEAAPAGSHTRAEYMRVLDGFRAIYHGDPSDIHAPRAVEQVAELLAEQGRELSDRKSLHDAAKQYEFLASQYPAASIAPESLRHAMELLGPDAANDNVEARKVRADLEANYPRYARTVLVRETKTTPVVTQPAKVAQSRERRDLTPSRNEAQLEELAPPLSSASVPKANSSTRHDDGISTRMPAGSRSAAGKANRPAPAMEVASSDVTPLAPPVRSATLDSTHPIAQVTGIRHWSTSTYTRVAIDLGDEVQFEAARVENPDRIFFDLHHARLASQLAGKSFSVTDDGFLTKIRAAQFSGDITRVVLDVHEVTEYSAFLLPNPYRLIIDIHGRRSSEQRTVNSEQLTAGNGQGIGSKEQRFENRDQTQEAGEPAVSGKRDLSLDTTGASSVAQKPVEREVTPQASQSAAGTGGVEVSSLPPMPVTDGSGAFGLPAKRTASGTNGTVAPPRVVISARPTQAKPVPNTVVSHTNDSNTAVAAVSDQPGKVEATSRPTSQPIVARSRGSSVAGRDQKPVRVAGVPTPPPPPTADGETSLVRALGLKIGRIVIDAGHGGHDSGTLGVDGIEEKDVVLDVALRLGKLLHDRLGAEIVYTRADDTFIPLETRTAIANKAQADLFISVHANSSPEPDARGVEVYYLNFTSDPDAMRVAGRENAVSTQSVHELSDLVKKIALKDKIDESRELAADVDESLYKGLAKGNEGLKNRGVKKAPFVVLIGANMPSILAEISFVTNPADAEKLSRPEYRQRVAESLYGGVARYASAINGRVPVTERAATGSR